MVQAFASEPRRFDAVEGPVERDGYAFGEFFVGGFDYVLG